MDLGQRYPSSIFVSNWACNTPPQLLQEIMGSSIEEFHGAKPATTTLALIKSYM
jgi:hypothetical protein